MGADHRRQVQRWIINRGGETIAMGEMGRYCLLATSPNQNPQELISCKGHSSAIRQNESTVACGFAVSAQIEWPADVVT